jgi:hypothetical protein
MTDLVAALQDKISALEDEKEELEDALARIEIKLETYAELLAEESGEAAPAPKKRGRPKGSKNKKRTPAKKKQPANAPKDELWEQAAGSVPDGGSTAEDQKRAMARFNPTPRDNPNYGVKAGTMEEVMGDDSPTKKGKGHVNISVEDSKGEE